ncbi:MAG TPA: helix-turn-helix domain-containing protein [Acidimicrobiales bacterium]|nr:helix-turn-helix domain-containing protein [Acidimicrobiales bacterium]
MRTAGELLRSARNRAGLSQADLAERAGVTQSVISAYESGARQPSLPTLGRLVEATGLALEVRISPVPELRHARPLARSVSDHRDDVLEVLGRYALGRPRLFGSVARGEEKPGSDIDILIDVPPGTGLLVLARCQADLEALLGAPVDLVPAADLKPGLAEGVLAEAVPL